MAGFCKELSEHQNVEIDFNHSNVPSMIPPEVALCLFRVLQQALHNAVRQASGVRSFRVDLRGASDEIQLYRERSRSWILLTRKWQCTAKSLGLIQYAGTTSLWSAARFSIDSKLNCGTTVLHVKECLCGRQDEMVTA